MSYYLFFIIFTLYNYQIVLKPHIPEKWSPGKMVLRKMVPEKMVPEKNGPRKNGLREKWFPENWSPGNLETKNRGVGVEHRVVYVECWNVINLWKPKAWQQTQNSEYPSFGFVVNFLLLTLPGPFFRRPIFRGPFFRGPYFGDHFSGEHFSGIFFDYR